MKLSARLLLAAFIGAASAISDGRVYIFQRGEWLSTSNPPSLTSEEARLVFAQRLGVSRYHGIGDASESTLSHINTFGRRQGSIFQGSGRDEGGELVVLLQSANSLTLDALLDTWSSFDPAFTISNVPSAEANLQLVLDLSTQLDGSKGSCAVQDERCWEGEAKLAEVNLSDGRDTTKDLMATQEKLIESTKYNGGSLMVVILPASGSTKDSKPYGSYLMPTESWLGKRDKEEPMTDLPALSSPAFKSEQVVNSKASTTPEPITGVPKVCYTSLDFCMNSTNSCSGHGKCFKKYGPVKENDKAPTCYTCGCVPTEESFLDSNGKKKVYRITYWGGAACQKKDVSGPFWLFALLTVFMVGLISWSIGLLFSIGEEKLPGVIGAGVSSKTR